MTLYLGLGLATLHAESNGQDLGSDSSEINYLILINNKGNKYSIGKVLEDFDAPRGLSFFFRIEDGIVALLIRKATIRKSSHNFNG